MDALSQFPIGPDATDYPFKDRLTEVMILLGECRKQAIHGTTRDARDLMGMLMDATDQCRRMLRAYD